MELARLRLRNRGKKNQKDIEICIPNGNKNPRSKKIGIWYINPSKEQFGHSHNQTIQEEAEKMLNLENMRIKAAFSINSEKDETPNTFVDYFRMRAISKKGQYLYCYKKYKEWTYKNKHLFIDINYTLMKAFYDYLVGLEEISIDTANCYFNKFSGTVTEAVKEGYLTQNPVLTRGLNRKKPTRKPKVWLNEKELNSLLEVIPETRDEKIAKEMFTIGSFTGLRMSDILTLSKSEVSTDENGNVFIGKTQNKTGETIYQYFIEDAEKLILSNIQKSKSDLVFENFKYSSSINNALRDLYSRVKIDKNGHSKLNKDRIIKNKRITLGCARNTHASKLYRTHRDAKLVKDSLGHRSYKYIDNYTNTTNEERLEKLKKAFKR